ncbi:hypothetical protein ACP70R_030979 [Stipagrostis hirtigluma subsp. patula]
MAEGTPNSSEAPLAAGAAGRVMDPMRSLESPRPPPPPPPPPLPDGHVLESRDATADWAQLQQDLLVGIFSRLDLPDLVYSGAVCTPWRLSYLAVRRFRLYSPYQSPYLVYSSGDRDGNTDTLHSLCTNRQSDLHLLNPITGAQLALPPAHTVKGVSLSFTGDGVLDGHYISHLDLRNRCVDDDFEPEFYPAKKTRQFLYEKVILSSDPSAGDCIVLLKHRPWEHFSFARIGDTKWTWLDAMQRCDRYDDFFYSADESLVFAVRYDGEIHTIDLNCPNPVVKVILNPQSGLDCNIHYILRAPWGDLLQVRRLYGYPPADSDGEKFIADYLDFEETVTGERRTLEDDELCGSRGKVTVHRVNLAEQNVTEIKDLQGHVLFVGFNSTFMIHARNFPNLSPNHVYVSDDNIEYIYCHPFNGRQCTCVNLEDGVVTDLSFSDSHLDWPPPVWFRPRLT